MSIKINAGLSKKIGLPDYGSLGATCNVEFELDGGYDNGSSDRFQHAIQRAYAACREAVEAEIRRNQGQGDPGTNNQQPNNQSNGSRNGRTNQRGATQSQVRAIHAIANRNRIDINTLLGSQFGVNEPDDLTIQQASQLIDQLKESGTGNGVSNR